MLLQEGLQLAAEMRGEALVFERCGCVIDETCEQFPKSGSYSWRPKYQVLQHNLHPSRGYNFENDLCELVSSEGAVACMASCKFQFSLEGHIQFSYPLPLWLLGPGF